MKKIVINFPVLRYYDVNFLVAIQCDSSDIGLGAVLMQEDRSVAFASRMLTPMEHNSYAPIEKECLDKVFACYQFEQYIYGKESVFVESDHKPLQVLFRKPLVSAPKRLQGMLLYLQMFHLTVKYKNGSEMYIGDMLSRAALPETGPCRGK